MATKSKNKYSEIESIAEYNRKNGTNFYKLDQVKQHKKENSPIRKILNTAMKVSATPGVATTAATSGQYIPKNIDSTVGQELGYLTSLVTTPMLAGEFTVGTIPGLIKIGGGMAGAAAGSYVGGKAGDFLDNSFGTSWMGDAGRLVGGLGGWGAGSKAGYKGLVNYATKHPFKIGTNSQFIGDVADKIFKDNISSTNKFPSFTKIGDLEINPDYYYRQGDETLGLDFISSKKVRGKSYDMYEENIEGKRIPLEKFFDEPMFAKGMLWYGEGAPYTLVTKSPMNYANKYGHITSSLNKAGVRRLPHPDFPLTEENVSLYKWDPNYGYRLVHNASNPDGHNITIPLKQRRVISQDTYPYYGGPRHSVSEVVNEDGTVNPFAALKIQREVADNIPGAYRMEVRLENPEWHINDPNTWMHTKNVGKSAYSIPTPQGITKQDQMIAALGHDFGKMITGEGHGKTGASLLEQIFEDITPEQLTAIREHMGEPKSILGQVTKQADILNGQKAINRVVGNNGKIRLRLANHTDSNPREIVLEPQGNNKFYVHVRTWDGDHIPADIPIIDKQTLYNALYEELPQGSEILFPQSGPGNYATRGTVAALKRLSRDNRFTPTEKGVLQYKDKDGSIKTFEGTGFRKGEDDTAFELPRFSGVSVDPSNPQTLQSLITAYKGRYPTFQVVSNPTKIETGGKNYLVIGRNPITEDLKLHKDLIRSRLDNLNSGWRDEYGYYVDPKTHSANMYTGESILNNTGENGIVGVLPLDQNGNMGGFYNFSGRYAGQPFVVANAWRKKPLRYTQLHESISHPTDELVSHITSDVSGKSIKDMYTRVTQPSDLFPDFQNFFKINASKDWIEGRAVNNEMVKRINELISKKTGKRLTDVYKNPKLLEDFVNTQLKDDRELVRFLKSMDSGYLTDYANLLESHIGTKEGTLYANRIRNMIKILPAIVGIGVIGESTLKQKE